MKPYRPPIEGRRNSGALLLDFNERTLPPSEKVLDALKEFLKSGQLQIYPEYGNVLSKISEYARVPEENLLLTNGSDQGIDVVFRSFLEKGHKTSSRILSI